MKEQIKKVTLYAHTEEIEALEEMLQQDDGEITEAWEELNGFITEQLEKKTDSCVGFLDRMDDEIASAKRKIDNLKEFIEIRKNAQANFKKYVIMCMDKLGVDKFEGEYNKISRRKGVDKVKITDENAIPMEYLETVVKVQSRQVKADLELGREIEGATLVKGEDSIQIRARGTK